MKELFTVASYTIKEMLKRKSFIISNAIILILIIVGFNIPNIIGSITGDSKSDGTSTIIVVDRQKIFEGKLEILNQMQLGYQFEIQPEDVQEDIIKERVNHKEVEAALIIYPKEGKIQVEYQIESEGMTTYVPTQIIEALSKIYANNQLEKLNLSQEEITSLYPVIEMQTIATAENAASGNVFVVMLLSLVLFYAVYFCAYQVSTSITTEKTSRIIETLVTSTTPKTIVLGKTVGIGIVGLIQVTLIITVAVISAYTFMDTQIISQVLDLSNITPMLGILTLVYFILGYSVYALLYALTGSTVSKPEDVQSANGPVAIVAVVGFYLAYFSMMNPTSSLNIFASIFPLSSPFCMPLRIMLGTANIGEIITSLIVLIITILVIAKISIKIYSSAILNYGKSPIGKFFKLTRK